MDKKELEETLDVAEKQAIEEALASEERILSGNPSRKDLLFQQQLQRAQKAMIADAKTHNANLRQTAKKPEELITGVEAVVTKADFYSTPDYERVPTSSWEAPMASDISVPTTKLYAKFAIESNSLTRKILFNGNWPHIFSGDRIMAYVFAGKKHYEKDEETGISQDPHYDAYDQIVEPPFHWLPRQLEEKEKAIKIEKLGDKKEILATYHSTQSSQENSKDAE